MRELRGNSVGLSDPHTLVRKRHVESKASLSFFCFLDLI